MAASEVAAAGAADVTMVEEETAAEPPAVVLGVGEADAAAPVIFSTH